MSASDARIEFAEVLNRAAYGKERVVFTRRGKRLAAIVPVEDLELLEELENRADVAAAERELRRMKKAGEKPIPWAKLKKSLGLK